MNSATVFAPATVANVAVGFDILGFAVEQVGDVVTVEKTDQIGEIKIRLSDSDSEIPTEANRNTAGVALRRMMDELTPSCGFLVTVKKGIPLSSGMGGSAASAVGAVVAANQLMNKPFSREELLEFALVGETAASGNRHADNVAPCLFGGVVLVRSVDPLEVLPVPYPGELLCVLVHPDLQVQTRDARKILKPEVPLNLMIRQTANLAGFLMGCAQKDFALIGRSLRDVIIEPQRAHLVPGFLQAKAQAMEAGALGCSLSGSGPSIFALVVGFEKARNVKDAIIHSLSNANVATTGSWIAPISSRGARNQ